MVKHLIYIVIFGTLLFTVSCVQQEQKESASIITVSILPQKYLVEQIAGNLFEVDVLIPPGASPVTYEPLPAQLTSLKKSNLYFQIGHLVFEESWTNKLKSVNPDLEIVELSKGLKMIEGEHHHGEETEQENGHGHVNPHVWMSPSRMKVMAKTVCESLKSINPEKGDVFERNLSSFEEKIDSLDVVLNKAFNKLAIRSFLIYHPALTYFAEDYGLKERSLENEGKEPSPKEMAELIDIARDENIKTILVQKQFDKSNATTLAKEIGARVVAFDPLSEDWLNEILKLKEILTKE